MSDEEASKEELYGLEKAVATAWSTLSSAPSEQIVKNTQCMLGDTSNIYLIRFLGEDYLVKPNEQVVETPAGEQFYNMFKIGILLHYMTNAKELPLKNKLISFRELWGGNEYYYAFNNRVLKPLTEHFAEQPEQFKSAGYALGGVEVEKGEYGFTIQALPRVPITVLFWAGDDEVQASANVLFDASANEQMETEALVWLAVAMLGELKKL